MKISALRLGELASDGVDVQLQCHGCGNQVVARASQLADHFGSTVRLNGLSGQLKCPLCGSAAVEATPGEWARHATP